jgi:signal peptidase I
VTDEFDEAQHVDPARPTIEFAPTRILDPSRPSVDAYPSGNGHVDARVDTPVDAPVEAGAGATGGIASTVASADAGPVAQVGTGPAETPPTRKAKSSSARIFVDWVVVIAIALLVAFLVRGFVLAHFVVDGSSMSPTLESGDRVFVNKLSYRLHDPNRGDVVVLHQISGASERDLIKRVIALPGEEIEMRSCQVFIDGAALDEPYLDPATQSGSCGGDFAAELVPADSVFVMGDNRGGSQDSRQLGPIEYDDLVGRAFVVFWPVGHWQWL